MDGAVISGKYFVLLHILADSDTALDRYCRHLKNSVCEGCGCLSWQVPLWDSADFVARGCRFFPDAASLQPERGEPVITANVPIRKMRKQPPPAVTGENGTPVFLWAKTA
jgi:hypothetical protein